MCSCHLFLVFSASVSSISFLSFWDHPSLKCSLGICSFLEEISSFSHSIIFLSFFALITEEGFFISPCYSLELCIQMGISFLFSFAFHFSPFRCLSCMKKYYRLCGLGEGNGNPLQCSCLENPVDRSTWWAAIYGVTQGWTQLKRACMHVWPWEQKFYFMRVLEGGSFKIKMTSGLVLGERGLCSWFVDDYLLIVPSLAFSVCTKREGFLLSLPVFIRTLILLD